MFLCVAAGSMTEFFVKTANSTIEQRQYCTDTNGEEAVFCGKLQAFECFYQPVYCFDALKMKQPNEIDDQDE